MNKGDLLIRYEQMLSILAEQYNSGVVVCTQCENYLLEDEIEYTCNNCYDPLCCELCSKDKINKCEQCLENTCANCLSEQNICLICFNKE